MKRILSVILVVTALWLLNSCGDDSINTSIGSQTESALSSSGIYNIQGAYLDMPTRVLFQGNTKIYYYNKLDEESYLFCFDPLCKHGDDCLSSKFKYVSFEQPFCYCEYDNRIYAVRGSKLVSVAFDGSDVKILYSFSDADEWNDLSYDSSTDQIQNLAIYGTYLYMTVENKQSGFQELCRYDIENGIFENLMKNGRTFSHIGYFVSDGEFLYFEAMKDEQWAFYQSDMLLNDIKLIDEQFDYQTRSSIFNGTQLYLTVTGRKEIEGRESYYTDHVIAFDLKTGTETIVCQFNYDKTVHLLAATDQYLYYQVQDNTVLYSYFTRFGTPVDVKNQFSKIYRFDLNTRETTIVMDDLSIETHDIFLMENKVIMKASQFEFKADGSVVEKLPQAYIADIDENGMFVNIRILEE